MNNRPEPAAFTCTYSPEMAELLYSMHCSVAISTYQAGKLIFLSANENKTITQLPRNFKRAMGFALDEQKIALATEEELIVFSNAKSLAAAYPNKPGYYDSFFVPRAAYYTGAVDIHDVAWDKNGRLCAVNTLFSSLVYINDSYSFEPFWMPAFINDLSSEDYCHLNGMTLVDGLPKYVTMFGKTNTPKGWRSNVKTGGLIIDVQTNEIIIEGLAMPHSPRWFNDALYCLLSATGELVKIDIAKGTYDVITKHQGFVRGLAQYNEYLFVGLSKDRKTSSENRQLPVSQQEMGCGVDVVHLPTARIIGSLRYLSSAEEIYDVQVLPNSIRPGIINHLNELHRQGLHTPLTGYWMQKKD